MDVVHITPPFLALHEDLVYGGIERIVNTLRSEQKRMGVSTSVLAPSDSTVEGLIPTVPSIGVGDLYDASLDPMKVRDHTWAKVLHVAKVLEFLRAHPSVIVHSHDDHVLPFLASSPNPWVHTVHCDYEEFWPLERFPVLGRSANHLVALSQSHKSIYESHGYAMFGVVNNGLPVGEFRFEQKKDGYLLSLSVIAPHKGQKEAIVAARAAKKPLIIAGNIGNRQYFDEEVRPHLDADLSSEQDKLTAYRGLLGDHAVVYVGPVNDAQKKPLYEYASAFLMTCLWHEPWPTIGMEALLCGTPVIALNKGPAKEMVLHGTTGFVAEDVNGMVHAARHIGDIDPARCRSDAERRFGSERMAEQYQLLYARAKD